MLKLPEILPDTLKEKEAAEAAAINVLASMLYLIGRQLAYSKTFGGKFGNICLFFRLIIIVQAVHLHIWSVIPKLSTKML